MALRLFTCLVALLLMLPLPAQAVGILYTNSISPVMATGAKPPAGGWASLKQGRSQSMNYLYLVEIGDAGINKACQQGGVQRVHAIDVHIKSVFIFFKRVTTIVYGE
ncbi:MAG: TRL domain-containing protein [Vampirovibrionales bacterium]